MQHLPDSAVLVFEEIQFDVVDLHNTPWLRGYQLGKALGYSDGSVAIAKLYDRNADEFTDEMTQVVDLHTAGGRQPVRVFSPRGCYLLGMLARTPRAKTFRVWVLDVLEGRLPPRRVGALTMPQQLAALRYRGLLVKELAAARSLAVAMELYANLVHISRPLGIQALPIATLAPIMSQGKLPGVL